MIEPTDAAWEPESITSTFSLADLIELLPAVLRAVGDRNERALVVDDSGAPQAAVIGVADLQHLEALEDLNDRLLYEQAKAEGGERVPWEVLSVELGLGDADQEADGDGSGR